MPKEAVTGIIRYKGMVLLARKKIGKGFLSGEWHIPGETKEGWESDEEALKRGIREEAGIEIKVGEYIGSHTTPKHTKVRWYECQATTTRVTPDSDVDEALFVPNAQVSIWNTQLAYSHLPKEILNRLGY